ncbi:hypothetical protein GCM10009573_23150 [Agromyces bracchium]
MDSELGDEDGVHVGEHGVGEVDPRDAADVEHSQRARVLPGMAMERVRPSIARGSRDARVVELRAVTDGLSRASGTRAVSCTD